MSRSRRKEHNRLPPFVPLLKDTLAAPAWRAMSHGARSLYVALPNRARRVMHQNLRNLSTTTGMKMNENNQHDRGRTMTDKPKPAIRFVRLPEVMRRTGKSRSSIYADPRFPRSVKIGPRASAWVESEITEYQQGCIAMRDAGGSHHDI
jgi:prophage regulatory protein